MLDVPKSLGGIFAIIALNPYALRRLSDQSPLGIGVDFKSLAFTDLLRFSYSYLYELRHTFYLRANEAYSDYVSALPSPDASRPSYGRMQYGKSRPHREPWQCSNRYH